MRVPSILIGLAGVAGVAATGVLVVRARRSQRTYDPDELRDRLHRRLDSISAQESDGPGRPQPGRA